MDCTLARVRRSEDGHPHSRTPQALSHGPMEGGGGLCAPQLARVFADIIDIRLYRVRIIRAHLLAIPQLPIRSS